MTRARAARPASPTKLSSSHRHRVGSLPLTRTIIHRDLAREPHPPGRQPIKSRLRPGASRSGRSHHRGREGTAPEHPATWRPSRWARRGRRRTGLPRVRRRHRELASGILWLNPAVILAHDGGTPVPNPASCRSPPQRSSRRCMPSPPPCISGRIARRSEELTHRQAPPGLGPVRWRGLWWWQFHQGTMTVDAVAILAWFRASRAGQSFRTPFFSVVLALAAAAVTLRLNLLFTSRVHPAILGTSVRLFRWIVAETVCRACSSRRRSLPKPSGVAARARLPRDRRTGLAGSDRPQPPAAPARSVAAKSRRSRQSDGETCGNGECVFPLVAVALLSWQARCGRRCARRPLRHLTPAASSEPRRGSRHQPTCSMRLSPISPSNRSRPITPRQSSAGPHALKRLTRRAGAQMHAQYRPLTAVGESGGSHASSPCLGIEVGLGVTGVRPRRALPRSPTARASPQALRRHRDRQPRP